MSLNLEKEAEKEEKQEVLERLKELEDEGVLDKLREIDGSD
ncbi:MAG TPA: hypothetical protein VKM69_04685 [Natronoarchaeum rubrum]|nr:hypothetical protein [Natronoarchaeum rubrum]